MIRFTTDPWLEDGAKGEGEGEGEGGGDIPTWALTSGWTSL